MKVRLKRLGILLIMTLSLFVCAITSTATDFCKEFQTTENSASQEKTHLQPTIMMDFIHPPMVRLAMHEVPEATMLDEIQPTDIAESEKLAQADTISEVTEPEETEPEIVETTEPVEEREIPEETKWDGPVLDSYVGTITGPSGRETFYDLPMKGVINIMEDLGYVGEEWYFWIREDGVKMYGKYIMCAANLDIRPKGTIIETSLGTAIVCDTGGFAKYNKYQLDIATDWTDRNGY